MGGKERKRPERCDDRGCACKRNGMSIRMTPGLGLGGIWMADVSMETGGKKKTPGRGASDRVFKGPTKKREGLRMFAERLKF